MGNNVLNYKLFIGESNVENAEDENEFSIEENIEFCKDFIETFDETNKEYKVVDYMKGFYSYKRSSYYYKSEDENDDICLTFALVPSSMYKMSSTFEYNFPISIEDIDEIRDFLSKVKIMITRLSSYCTSIKYDNRNKKHTFCLIFKNTNDEEKKYIKLERIFRLLKSSFGYTSYRGTRSVLNYDCNANNYQRLSFLTDKAIFKNGEKWDRLNRLDIRYHYSIESKNSQIIFNIMKYTYRIHGEGFKNFRLTEDDKIIANNFIYDNIKRFLSNDIDSINIKVESDKIIIELK